MSDTSKKKTIIVTGASRGIGFAIADELAGPDVHLVLMAKDKKNLELISDVCTAKGAATTLLSVDLSDLKDLKRQMDDLKKTVARIDVLVNNAGLWFEEEFEKGDMDVWDTALDVNLKSQIHLTRHCVDLMGEGSAIIFMGSTASMKTYKGGSNYCATKFGLLGFARSLFEDLREKGIKVCSILPGVVNTDMHKDDQSFDHDQMIQPADVAQLTRFILSMPSNSCITEVSIQPQKNPRVRPRFNPKT